MVSAQFTFKMCIVAIIAENPLKTLFWGFKVAQGHRWRYHWKAGRQCLLWQAASLCLSATVFTL